MHTLAPPRATDGGVAREKSASSQHPHGTGEPLPGGLAPCQPHTRRRQFFTLQADADEYSELRDALRRARAAFESYLALAPAEQVSAAREAEGREGGSR